MSKDIYKGKIGKDGRELAPDWTAMGIHPITGFRKGRAIDSQMEWYNKEENKAKRAEYMRNYYNKKKNR